MSAGPSKALWLTDPERARELERQAELQNAATPGGAPAPTDPRQLSLDLGEPLTPNADRGTHDS